MWIRPEGTRTGTISGGCLGGDVARKAACWTNSGQPVLRVYNTASDEDAVWALGLGCDGVIYVLLERADSPETRPLLAFLEEGRRAAGGRGRHRRARFGGPPLPHRSAPLRPRRLPRRTRRIRPRRPHLLHSAGANFVFEYIVLPQHLVVIGAGHDVIPTVQVAASLVWSVPATPTRIASPAPNRSPSCHPPAPSPASASIASFSCRTTSRSTQN